MAGKQLDPLQKEALVLEFKAKGGLMYDFCEEDITALRLQFSG